MGSEFDVAPLAPSPFHDELIRREPQTAARRSPPSRSGTPPFLRLSTVIMFLALLLLLSHLLPRMIEEYQYAASRGRQRAEYEVAAEALQELPLNALSQAYQLIAKKVGPSVVHINTHSQRQPREVAGRMTGQGSGVIVDSDGYILTNRHVIVGSDEILVNLSSGRTREAEVIGVDELTDLAVLKIDPANETLIPIDWADSAELEEGALVWAVGSPFGLERSITFGILSAKDRAHRAGNPHQNFLQTDAAVNPGNSGGPLVDSLGRLIGINTAIVGEAYQGISFAIPSNVARDVLERIRRDGRVVRAWLGVEPIDVPRDVALDLGDPDLRGAYVKRVVPEYEGVRSPAYRAGLRAGDIILQWDGNSIDRSADLYSLVADTDIGKRVRVVILRDGQELPLQVEVTEREEDPLLIERR